MTPPVAAVPLAETPAPIFFAALPERAPLDPWELLKLALAQAAEAQATIAQQRQRIRRLEALSVTDELTGLTNRRGFERELRRAIALARRQGTAGVLAFFDLDDFKAVNDTLGHAAGDVLLLTVGTVLRAAVRSTDAVARISGDEFACLLAPTDPAEGLAKAMRLREELEAASAGFAGRSIPIRASMGTAPFDGAADPVLLLKRADQAMYSDKRLRRTAPSHRAAERHRRG